LKAVHQIQAEGGTPEGSEWRMLKGGFGKAFQLLFNEWPTPDETRRFEKKLRRWMEKSMELDRIFIQAFNEYLRQKRLSSEELSEVLHRGRQ
jgi:hypothetical protein